MATTERFWTRRLRWRLRGAWLWPVFAAVTLGDALLLHLLPPVRTGVDFIPALIVSSFGNLFLVGAVAPWLARRLARREAQPGGTPFEVLLDRTASLLLLVGVAGVLASGLATRPLVVSETEDTEAAARAVRSHVERNATAEVRANVDAANTLRLAEDFFRICVPLNDRTRAQCYFVDTERNPPEVDPDRDMRPNALIRP